MVDVIRGLHRLRDADERSEIIDVLWDLRDSAFDHPASWQWLTAETLFQLLAETVENAQANGRDRVTAGWLLASALERGLEGDQRD